MSDRTALAKRLWTDLCEKDDRTSPADYPDHCLITKDEFIGYVNATDELDRTMDRYDPNGWATMLTALRNANDGFVLTVWNKSEDVDAGYKVWRTLDGKYAERDPGFAMNIPIHELCGELDKAIKEQPAMSSGAAELPKAAASVARDDVIEALREIASWRNDTLGERNGESRNEVNAAFDRGTAMAFHRCAARAIRALKAASSPADKVSDSHLKENSQADSTAPRSDAVLHIHATEITGVMGLTRYERRVPCTKCSWGHDMSVTRS